MKLYFHSLSMHLKSDLEYRSSFILSLISQILVMFSYYVVILALFNKFNNIKGFTLYEVLLCFSIIQFGFAFVEVFARGVDKFERLIIDGSFDRLLVRPKNILLQVLASDMDFIKITRMLQNIIIMFIALYNLNIEWSIFKVIILLMMIISSIVIFFSLFLYAASYCFLTVQGLEVKNLITDGGKYMAQYPIGVFSKGFVFLFTFIIPYGFVNYYPLLYFIGKSNNVFYALSPILVFLYLIPAILVFYKGIKRYTGTGS